MTKKEREIVDEIISRMNQFHGEYVWKYCEHTNCTDCMIDKRVCDYWCAMWCKMNELVNN